MDARISAIITTYKRDERFLERAILSVLNQTYQNIELLVVDDNGLDSSYHKIAASLVKKYQEEYDIQLIAHDVNEGAQKARNTGIKSSSGEYIAFLDDDDEWIKTKIEQQLKVFKESKIDNVGLVYCWYNVLTELSDGSVEKEIRELPVYTQEEVLTQLFRLNFIASTSFPLIKRECFDRVGLFDETLEASQDYDMWVRIAKEFAIGCKKKVLVHYYKHAEERITENPAKKARAEKAFLQKYYSDIKKDTIAYSDKNKKIGIYLMRTGKGKEARNYFWESIKCAPIGIRIYKYVLESYVLEAKLKKKIKSDT